MTARQLTSKTSRRGRHLHLESLESRQLLSAVPSGLSAAFPSSDDEAVATATTPDGQLVVNAAGSTAPALSDDQPTEFVGSNDHAQLTVTAPNGKLIVAGTVTFAGETYLALARYNADGAIDSSFGNDGRVTLRAPWSLINVAVGSDGRIVVLAAPSFSLDTDAIPPRSLFIRFTANGQLDTTFGIGGFVESRDNLSHIAIQSDSTIVATRWGEGIYRILADGTIQPAETDVPLPAKEFQVRGILTGKDDRIFAAGWLYEGGHKFFALRAYDRNGLPVPDSDFTKFEVEITGSEGPMQLALQPDGKILVGANVILWVGGTAEILSTFSVTYVARLNADGSPDMSFSGDGIASADSGDFHLRSVVVDQVGSILIVGDVPEVDYLGEWVVSPATLSVFKFDSGGTLDSSFSLHPPDVLTVAVGASIDAEGHLLVVGNDDHDFALLRYLSDGTIDASYAEDGLLHTDFRPPLAWHNSANPLDIDGDGVVRPIDALHLINELNASGPRTLGIRSSHDLLFDVNGDELLTPLDLIEIINELNAQEAQSASDSNASGSLTLRGDSAVHIPDDVVAVGQIGIEALARQDNSHIASLVQLSSQPAASEPDSQFASETEVTTYYFPAVVGHVGELPRAIDCWALMRPHLSPDARISSWGYTNASGYTAVHFPTDGRVHVGFSAQDPTLGEVHFEVSFTAGGRAIGVLPIQILPRSAWQNGERPHDVDGDGELTPLDALLLINELNASGRQQLTSTRPANSAFLDTSGDTEFTAADVLLVINELNGFLPPPSPPSPPTSGGYGGSWFSFPSGDIPILIVDSGVEINNFDIAPSEALTSASA